MVRRKFFSFSRLTEMGCCSCFGFLSNSRRQLRTICGASSQYSQEFLLPDDADGDGDLYNGDSFFMPFESNGELQRRKKVSEEILLHRIQSGMICREIPVKETRHVIRTETCRLLADCLGCYTSGDRPESPICSSIVNGDADLINYADLRTVRPVYVKLGASANYTFALVEHPITMDENGNKMVNEYVRECKIGSGSYAKVVLYRSTVDGKRYAIKAFHKSHLLRLRVAPSETAMTDVLREVLIMKMLDHPNIVNLIEVIDDPNTDHFYMVLEYVEGKWVCEGSGPPGGLREDIARRFLRDIVSGLMYLHSHNIVHGDIKPDNLLVTSSGTVKIGDFSVSQVFEDDNDELRRSPGTPVFTAPECCLGLTYGGRAADTWALGVTLFCMVLGQYPFLGDTLQDTYDKIVNNPLPIPKDFNPHLKHLLEALLCKDPKQRIVLEDVAVHPWVVADEGPIPQFSCRCKRMNLNSVESADNKTSVDVTH